MTINDDILPESSSHRTTAEATATAKESIDTASAGAQQAIDVVSSKMDDWRSRAAPALKRGVDQARGWVDQNADRVQDGITTARNKANDLTDQVVDYTRDEPVKALLIAAAVGAGLVAMIRLLVRTDD